MSTAERFSRRFDPEAATVALLAGFDSSVTDCWAVTIDGATDESELDADPAVVGWQR